MALTPRERRSLLAEAGDPRRREVQRRFRPAELDPEAALAWIDEGRRLFGRFDRRPRRRPRPDGPWLL